MRIKLEYGKDGLEVEIPSTNVTVISPRFIDGLPDEKAAFIEAVRSPINSQPIKEKIQSSDKVAIVIPDITRPLPTSRLLPWLFEELSHVPVKNFVIVNGTGSHRINTPTELEGMVGKDILSRYKIVNHNSHDPSTMKFAGRTPDGFDVYLTRDYVEADKRIVLGFIEPHFMAGFSGGYKGIFPAIADIDSIMRYHNAKTVGHAGSIWGMLENNPTQNQIRENGSLLPVDMCINVTLNRHRQISGFFCGDSITAHEKGCEFSKSTAMVPCAEPFPIIVTTNSGYPLDQNLYQTVKGMSAASQVVADGGLIVAVSKCNDGFPGHGNFKNLLFDHDSPQAILDTINAPGFSLYDQWEAQLLAIILLKARTALYSELKEDDVRRAHLIYTNNITDLISNELNRIGKDAPIAVLPEGPMTIPYIN